MAAHDDDREPEYDGMDALMAALLDEPPPARARRDPAFLAAHGAAVADLEVLRERLALIGDALAAPAGDAPAGAGDAAPAAPTGTEGRSPEGADPGSGAAAGRPPLRSRSAPPGGPRGPRGPHRARRPLRTALGALAAAAAATLVVGMGGWLVAQGGGASGAADSKAASDAAAGERADGAAFGSPGHLACTRLVAEGVVLAVEPVPGAGRERITLRVSRAYKGTQDDRRVAFVLDPAGQPRLGEGDRVMVGLPLEGDRPDTVIVGEEDIAPERSRITAALPESRTLTCG
ncbi:hypothetical protein [Streptomyces sp. Tu 3180]|uniref:hypothetical protein n=1 Tax=Streptomyces sp. Tu 3180 TaxID=2682611 RepID=UPI00135C8131|nr:hypothetical protein [Streptomyces sp. Tu 3180]KAF3465414.1 hypothetical protein GL259_14425 [Streptomyces sp. Tu 3180]